MNELTKELLIRDIINFGISVLAVLIFIGVVFIVFEIKRLKVRRTIKMCNNCSKKNSMRCPNSIFCYATKDKPYFERKEEQL